MRTDWGDRRAWQADAMNTPTAWLSRKPAPEVACVSRHRVLCVSVVLQV
jgi:hypothetical protein